MAEALSCERNGCNVMPELHNILLLLHKLQKEMYSVHFTFNTAPWQVAPHEYVGSGEITGSSLALLI